MKKELIIVGAGLSAGSITADGIEAVRSADVVLYDRLTDEKLLKYAACECINVGKQPYHSNCVKQQDINGLITEHLEMDRRVVRLKGGDSAIFARSLEEAEAARLTGAQVKIIPGVTSASSLTARIEGALTDRRHAHGVMFITGHTKTDELDTVYNWRAIASLGFTICCPYR
jgi:uroporphyrin-III C-methyltransferase